MKKVVYVVNSVKAKSLSNRICSQMCSYTGSDCVHYFIILRPGGCREGTSLHKLWRYAVRSKRFCLKKNHPLSEGQRPQVDIKSNVSFRYICWNKKSEYSAQGLDQIVTEQLIDFRGKLKLKKDKIEENKTPSFPTMNSLFERRIYRRKSYRVSFGRTNSWLHCSMPEAVARYR
jgi:hypothetical protein